ALSRRLGGWQVISWALLLALPVMAIVALITLPSSWKGIGGPAWLALAYVSVFSMLIGFVFWYQGLAKGGIAAVGQLQLLQPFFGLVLAAALLHEQVSALMLGGTIGVVACVAGARRFARWCAAADSTRRARCGSLARPHAPVAQLDRVAASEAAGRGFESRRARHLILVHTGHGRRALTSSRRAACCAYGSAWRSFHADQNCPVPCHRL